MSEPRPKKIAVIEDDEQIRTVVAAMLSAEGYQVVATGVPTEAYELVRREQPDLVLCDIAMPDVDGYSVLKAILSDPATAACPVVFLTAHQEFSERMRAFRFGVVDYVTKPFTRAILLRKVERIFHGRELRSGGHAAGITGELLDEVQRDMRSGVLTVKGEGGEQRVVLRAGEIVGAPPAEAAKEAPAEFTEIDTAREDIVAHDPPSLPSTPKQLPTFDEIPAVLRNVLVVDDNTIFRAFLARLLTASGFTVHEAGNGEEALRLALESRPWLILTDVRMPGEDGFEFCRKVRSHTLLRQTPLIFLSGWDDHKARYQGLELGADDFLSKETPIRELLIRIQVILKRHLDIGARGRRGAGLEGQLQVMGAPGVLQVCHLTRLTGTLAVTDGAERMSVRFRDGEVVGAEGGALAGEEAVFALLAWSQGTFLFTPGPPPEGEPLGSFNQLVLEGCRRLDESRAAR